MRQVVRKSLKLTPSSLLTKLKMKLGIYTTPLPFENPDEAIMDVIKDITLPEYSSFFPYEKEFTMNLTNAQVIDRISKESVYKIPDELLKLPIQYIKNWSPIADVHGNDIHGSQGFTGGYNTGSGTVVSDYMMMKAGIDLYSQMAPITSVEFEEPNKIRTINLYGNCPNIRVTLAYTHAENLSTITQGAASTFFELALYDVADFLYSNLRGYNTIETPIGTLQLPLDDWKELASRREQLIEGWEETFHMDQVEPFYFV